MKASENLVCDLRHGIQLTAVSHSRHIKVRAVGDLLGEAMRHFKHHLHDLKTTLYTDDPYCSTPKPGRPTLAAMQLSYPRPAGTPGLSAALWTDAVISAYSTVNTVEQMVEELATWKLAVAKEGQSAFLRDVVGMLDKPGGDLQGMLWMLKHSLARDLEAGRYRPGEVVKP